MERKWSRKKNEWIWNYGGRDDECIRKWKRGRREEKNRKGGLYMWEKSGGESKIYKIKRRKRGRSNGGGRKDGWDEMEWRYEEICRNRREG